MRNRLLLLAAGIALSQAVAFEPPRPRPSPAPQATPTATPAPAAQPLPSLVIPEDTRVFVNSPTAGEFSVTGLDEDVRPYASYGIEFPSDVVEADKIDAEGMESPIAIWPELDAEFYWRTQSEGDLSVKGPVIPGQTYRFRLREGAKDLAGTALPVDAWGFEASSPALTVIEEGYGERERLNSRPQVSLEFNYPVSLANVAEAIWVQDRATRRKFPVEVLLNSADGSMDSADVVEGKPDPAEKIYGFRVRPLDALPVNRFYDLVVDGVVDAYAGRPMEYPKVFPLGTTRALEVDYVAARNVPLEKPRIEIKFRQWLSDEPLAANTVTISPTVPNLKVRKEGQYIVAEGDFDTAGRYTVGIAEAVIGVGGYGLAKGEVWGATFRPKPAAILFPAREIRQRAALGLRFAFYQVKTPALEWKLASIPLEKLNEILKRETEFNSDVTDDNGDPVWTEEGYIKRVDSEPLIPSFGLPVAATGNVPAPDGDAEVLREISWTPDKPGALSGPMLLEVTGTDAKGRVIGNRSVIYFGDIAITRKTGGGETVIRAASMSDAQPVKSATVEALDESLKIISTKTTDENGLARFPDTEVAASSYYVVRSGNTMTLQPTRLSDRFNGAYSSFTPPAPLQGYTFTDRPLYRPGQAVQFKGIVRAGEERKIPAGKTVAWTIERRWGGNEVFARGEAKLDAYGSWNGSWQPPEDSALGDFLVRALVDGQPAGSAGTFQIEEFRNPTFSVICTTEKATKPGESVIKVESQYFHGAANAGARVKWTATWYGDSEDGFASRDEDGMLRVDLYSEHAAKPTWTAEATGETALDANGAATITCAAPFKDLANRAECSVIWKAEVTGPDGQTITGGASEDHVAMVPVQLGIKGEAGKQALDFHWNAKEPFGKAPGSVQAELFHVVTKSVKERIAPNVYRYRNFDRFIPIEKREGVGGEDFTFTPREPGRYVCVISPPAGAEGMPVSEEVYLEGAEESQVAVQSDTAATVVTVNSSDSYDKPWKVGGMAAVNVLTPSAGVAWVSIETDHILDTFTVPIPGNTSRIDIPVKPEYEPNVTVAVYVLRPGGSNELAGEMFGYTGLRVIAPDRTLDVAVKTDKEDYEPRERISGEVRVTAGGKPVPGADLAIYAVDDSILELGGWVLPQMLSTFFPERPYAVLTWSALNAYVDKIAPSWLTMKGFVVGDGGDEPFSNVTFARKEFKPIILWKPNVKTDARGIAKFSCEAPDNLTRFRAIAAGQTKANQFGSGDATFTISKMLQVEPALPRFLREGDEIELRAVVRQKIADSDDLLVRCFVSGGVELAAGPEQRVTAPKDAPVVVRFKARAKSTGPATVKFQAAAAASKFADAVEVTLPVAEPVILKKESVGGTVGGPVFPVREVAPGEWENTRGSFNLSISSTPWLPRLMGLPYLLQYPHGCFEQKSSRLLAYTYLGGLLEYLPDAQARHANYERVVHKTLEEFEAGMLPSGMLPYWPSGVEPNSYVTIQAAWCVSQAEQAGFDVPENLSTVMPDTLRNIARGRTETAMMMRAFALFVFSTFEGDIDEDILTAANEVYPQRDKLTGEGRAMLAIAFNNFGIEEEKQRQLLSELPTRFDGIEFQSATFASATRTEALCLWARILIEPEADMKPLRERLEKLMESSQSLSTQENLWLLVAFDALLENSKPTLVKEGSLKPRATTLSENGTAAAWLDEPISRLAELVITGLPSPRPPGSFVLSAAYRTNERETPSVDHGMKIDRVVKNLSDPSRDGSEEHPFKLGDQLFISYRFSSDKPQSYVALEDMLPAGIEVVNPNLALFGQFYAPPAQGIPEATLSHSELRDQQTNLYFDNLSAGQNSYGVLARATAAGSFIWPATQIAPMYDSRFFGRSASSSCAVSAD